MNTLANDLVAAFNQMKQRALDDPENAYDDAWMCKKIARAIKDCCDRTTITCNTLTGTISAGTIQSIIPAVTTQWKIDDNTLESDLKKAFSNTVDLQGHASKTSQDMADEVAQAIKAAIEGGDCYWEAITIICVPSVTPPPTVTVVGAGKGTYNNSAGASTCQATVRGVFNITVDGQGVATGSDTTIAEGIQKAVIDYLSGMVVDVEGKAAAVGATGKGVATAVNPSAGA